MPQIAFTTQPDGNRDYVNSRWQEYVGAPLREALGWGWLNAAHPEDKSSIEAENQNAASRLESPYTPNVALSRLRANTAGIWCGRCLSAIPQA